MSGRTPLRLVIGGGGVLLIGSLFMPWARGRSGWELLTTADVFFLIVGIVALGGKSRAPVVTRLGGERTTIGWRYLPVPGSMSSSRTSPPATSSSRLWSPWNMSTNTNSGLAPTSKPWISRH